MFGIWVSYFLYECEEGVCASSFYRFCIQTGIVESFSLLHCWTIHPAVCFWHTDPEKKGNYLDHLVRHAVWGVTHKRGHFKKIPTEYRLIPKIFLRYCSNTAFLLSVLSSVSPPSSCFDCTDFLWFSACKVKPWLLCRLSLSSKSLSDPHVNRK